MRGWLPVGFSKRLHPLVALGFHDSFHLIFTLYTPCKDVLASFKELLVALPGNFGKSGLSQKHIKIFFLG